MGSEMCIRDSIPACEKGFYDALEKGSLAGYPVCGVRFVLEDGAAHSVDSSELAFRIATVAAFREAFNNAQPMILEPKMTVEVVAPVEFQGAVIGALNQRKGTIEDTEVREDEFTIRAEVSLNDMFGYSSQRTYILAHHSPRPHAGQGRVLDGVQEARACHAQHPGGDAEWCVPPSLLTQPIARAKKRSSRNSTTYETDSIRCLRNGMHADMT